MPAPLHHDHQSLPGGQGRWAALSDPTTVTHPTQTRRSIHLEQGFGANRINTGTMTNLTTLGDTLLANFRTLHIPATERGRSHPADCWAMVRARRAEHLAAYARRDQLRRALVQHGYRCFLDRTWSLTQRVDGGSTSSSPTLPL